MQSSASEATQPTDRRCVAEDARSLRGCQSTIRDESTHSTRTSAHDSRARPVWARPGCGSTRESPPDRSLSRSRGPTTDRVATGGTGPGTRADNRFDDIEQRAGSNPRTRSSTSTWRAPTIRPGCSRAPTTRRWSSRSTCIAASPASTTIAGCCWTRSVRARLNADLGERRRALGACLMSGSGMMLGAAYQAGVIAWLYVHVLREQRLHWFELADDRPLAVAGEVSGPGDDVRIEFPAGVPSIEVQAKHGLSGKLRLREALRRISETARIPLRRLPACRGDLPVHPRIRGALRFATSNSESVRGLPPRPPRLPFRDSRDRSMTPA